MAEQPGLFGDNGKREVRVEWALRYTEEIPHVHRKGEISPCVDRAHAETIIGNQYYGTLGTEIVSRTVTTYTTNWTQSLS